MESIIDLHYRFYSSLSNNSTVHEQLEQEKIHLIDSFMTNLELVRTFYQTYYNTSEPRIVLCGTNPSRSRSGVPFFDYNSLSQLLPNIKKDYKERSAQFILSIINELGQQTFFNNVYLTYLSWFGFTRNNKYLDFDDLPDPLPTYFTQSFFHEMNIVQPKVIIPLSNAVERQLKLMNLPYRIGQTLPHPHYCGYDSISKRKFIHKNLYMSTLQNLIQEPLQV